MVYLLGYYYCCCCCCYVLVAACAFSVIPKNFWSGLRILHPEKKQSQVVKYLHQNRNHLLLVPAETHRNHLRFFSERHQTEPKNNFFVNKKKVVVVYVYLSRILGAPELLGQVPVLPIARAVDGHLLPPVRVPTVHQQQQQEEEEEEVDRERQQRASQSGRRGGGRGRGGKTCGATSARKTNDEKNKNLHFFIIIAISSPPS